MLAQPEQDLQSYKAKYPNEKAIYLNNSEEVAIDIVKGELKVYTKTNEERFFLNDKANIYSEKSIRYSGFFEISDIEAKTLLPDKNKYKELKVKEFKTKDVLSGNIFHDDVKSISFVYPSLGEGTKSVLQYKETIKEPRFLTGFYFGSYIPIEYAEYKITCHQDVELEYKLFGIKENEIEFTTSKEKNKIIYHWVMKNIKKMEDEDQTPDIKYIIPHIIIYIKSYKVNGKTKQVLSNVNDLHTWYYSLLKKMDESNNDLLKPLVDSLTSGDLTEIEKVKNIYYWVQDHIKYIAVEDGLAGFIPRNAATVFNKRYGDCKDMANIIMEMLKLADIKSYVTWLGTRDIPYTYHDVPTPAADNHMITTYINNGEYYFLDATGSYTPLGYPTYYIQGKEALLNLDSNNFEVVKIPEVDMDRNFFIDTVSITLQGTKMTGKGLTHCNGYYRVTVNRTFADLTEKEKLKTYGNFYSKGNNKFSVENVKEDNFNDRDKDLIVKYDFTIQDYAKTNNNELYVNMYLDKPYMNDKIKEDRKNDFEKRFKGKVKYVVILELPEGYHAEYIPKNDSFTHDLFGFSVKFSSDNKKIILDYELYTNHLLLNKTYFEDWNKMVKQLDKIYSDVVILKKD